jgi:putative ABC transport system substrate-binding protein
MNRRAVVTLIGGAAAWPLVARAQQDTRERRVAVLIGAGDDPEGRARLNALINGLRDAGWIEERNLRIDYRFSGGDTGNADIHAIDLARRGPDVIVANGTPATIALRRQTETIPIVMAAVSDPVAQGLVASLHRPGGNVTGFTLIELSVVGKMLSLLKDMVPDLARAAIMFNPDSAPIYQAYARALDTAPPLIGVDVTAAPVSDERSIDAAIAGLTRQSGGGLIVPPDPFTVVQRRFIMRLAQERRLPVIYGYRTFVAEGALMSYGADPYDSMRRAASYVDRILRGEKPADLPVQQPTIFELAINLKAAKAIGLEVPPMLLARADEVIE